RRGELRVPSPAEISNAAIPCREDGFGFKSASPAEPAFRRLTCRRPSGRDRFGLGFGLREIRHRLEAVAAGRATPQIGRTARTAFNPVRRDDRFAALSAGIMSG